MPGTEIRVNGYSYRFVESDAVQPDGRLEYKIVIFNLQNGRSSTAILQSTPEDLAENLNALPCIIQTGRLDGLFANV